MFRILALRHISNVPMKMLWPRSYASTWREAPSDLFYSDLTGNWDFDGDGLQSDFNFVDPPTGSSGNIFGTLGETGCGNTSNADGTTCDPIGFGSTTQQAVDAFTTGFNFGGGGDFQPQILDNYTGNPTGSMAATIETTDATGQALQFGALDFAGLYQGVNTFLLPPDHLANCTGEVLRA